MVALVCFHPVVHWEVSDLDDDLVIMHIVLMITKGRFSLNCTLDGPQRRNIVRPKAK
jgi:hypothetical protein